MVGMSHDGLPGTVCVIFSALMKVELMNFTPRALVATIRYLADFPCPHCLVLKSQIGDMGLVADMKRRANEREYPAEAVKHARKRIFEKGGSVNYRGIEDQLIGTGSWVPTEVGYTRIASPSIPDIGHPEWLLSILGDTTVQIACRRCPARR